MTNSEAEENYKYPNTLTDHLKVNNVRVNGAKRRLGEHAKINERRSKKLTTKAFWLCQN